MSIRLSIRWSPQKMNKKQIGKPLTIFGSVVVLTCLILLIANNFGNSPFIDSFQFNSQTTIHLTIEQYRHGILISKTYHAMSETNFGHNQTRDLLGGVNTNALLYFANSNDTSAFDATWTALPGETTQDGLGRALSTYTLDPSGNGKWNLTYTWTATGPITANLYGIYSTAYNGATLCYAEQQGAGNLKNLTATDTLKMVAQGTS
jgi:hypothetical protein